MKKDEFITYLTLLVDNQKEQLSTANATNQTLSAMVDKLNSTIADLNATIASLQEEIARLKGKSSQLDTDLRSAKKKNKALGGLLQKENEMQKPELTEEDKKVIAEARAIERKLRGNNGAKRLDHFCSETVVHEVEPDEPEFQKALAKGMARKDANGNFLWKEVVQYEYVPGKYIKHIYRVHVYSQDGVVYKGKVPATPLSGSPFQASAIAGIMQMRFMYAMPTNRIVSLFNESGFNLSRSTAYGLLDGGAEIIENLYKAIRRAVLEEDDYLGVDETYHKVLLAETDTASGGKGSRKAYLWVLVGHKTGMMYLLYDDGSRREKVILDELKDYHGILQSDAYSAYRKMESEAWPEIMRIACIQHIKRRFLNCKDDPDAQKIARLLAKLYHMEHEHKNDKDWTPQQNLAWRKQYAPVILKEIDDEIDRIQNTRTLTPKDELQEAINYMKNEWEAMKAIFDYGHTDLDNNIVERYNRYISLSRRNSMFFGSHAGARRAAMYYTVALSCRMQGINVFEYIVDILNRTYAWKGLTFDDETFKKYRELLPDRWQKASV